MMDDKNKCRNVGNNFYLITRKNELTNIMKVYHLIILCILLRKEMVTFDGNAHLNLAFQETLRYSQHRENYKKSLQIRVISSGLRIEKQPAFTPTTDFYIK